MSSGAVSTSGRYWLHTLRTEDENEVIGVDGELRRMLDAIYGKWLDLGCPDGEFMIEFAERKEG